MKKPYQKPDIQIELFKHYPVISHPCMTGEDVHETPDRFSTVINTPLTHAHCGRFPKQKA